MPRLRRLGLSRSEAIAVLRSEGLDVTEWSDEAGAVYEEHSHPGAEVRVVVEGGMTIRTDGVDHQLGPGDRFDLAPGEPHAASVHAVGVRYLAGTRREPVAGRG